MDASKLPKGQSALKSGDSRPINLPGVYIHKDSGNKFTTAPGDWGVVQADHLMSPNWGGAWQRVSDVPTREELLTARKSQELNDQRAEAKEKAELKVELDKVEAAVASNKN